jgi:TolA-binding protein
MHTLIALLALTAAAPVPSTAPAMSVASVAASLQTVEDCRTKVEELRRLVETASYTGRNPSADRESLLDRMNRTIAALNDRKYDEARKRAEDFKQRVRDLAAKGRLAQADADAILAKTDEAIACYESLRS